MSHFHFGGALPYFLASTAKIKSELLSKLQENEVSKRQHAQCNVNYTDYNSLHLSVPSTVYATQPLPQIKLDKKD